MPFTNCIDRLALADKLPINEMLTLADEYEARGFSPAAAIEQVVLDKIDLAKMEQASIEQTVADQYAARGGKKRGAGDAAVSAVKNLASGTVNAIDALGELFGGTKLNSGLTFNDETYAKAKPLFQEAAKDYASAGSDIMDVMRAVVQAVVDKFGKPVAANMKPYITRFVRDYRDGKLEGENNVDGTRGSVAGREGDRADGELGARASLFDVGPGIDGRAPGTDGATDQPGRGSAGSAGVSGRRAVAGGAQSDIDVPGQAGQGRPGASDSTDGDAGGSGRAGRQESQPGPDAEALPAAVAGARNPLDRKRAAQKKANAVPVKPGDRANIDATLPYLLDGQREDVAFAEARFANPEKQPGVMFTNGTGTGKTFTGGGIIARFARQGKDNQIVVVPNDGIGQDWIRSLAELGLEAKMLDGLDDNGDAGIVITTYANFGQNRTLADRNWDLVTLDESHRVMAAADGKKTLALESLQALTYHPSGWSAYTRMKNRDLYDRLAALPPAPAKADGNQAARTEFDKLMKEISEREESQRAEYEAIANAPIKRPKTLMLSATPFAYVKAVDYAEGYLFNYGDGGRIGNSNQDGRAHFFVQHFGYRIRYHKLTEPDGNVDQGLMARQFNNWLKAEGALSGRMLEVEADYERKFVMVESALGSAIDEGLEFMREHPKFKHLYQPVMKQFDYLSRRYLLEAIKAEEAIPSIQAQLDAGRKVVVVHDYKKGGSFNPFSMRGINGVSTVYENNAPKEIDLAALGREFQAARPDLASLQVPARSALQTLQAAFPDALVHNGSVPAKQLEANKVQFNDDNGSARLIILQSDKGREGISLHDTTGKYRRVMVNIGMQGTPTALIQLEGRIYRTGQVSNALFHYANTGTEWERRTFAETIAQRADTAEALAMGDQARGLKEAIIEAFQDSAPATVSDTDGTGGKARDRNTAKALTEWDKAKTFYYSQLKRNSASKSAEGNDYFATPEPVGMKMVEWADIRVGEDVMEPSAGHGAIARWFPAQTNKTIVEPETPLINRARLVIEGSNARFEQQHFEDLHVSNKYDAIVMNPPFGKGGSLSTPHLAKAFKHLREGGRIVALLPTGNMADKRLDAFLYAEDAPKDMHLVAEINLPAATFGRAGTGAMTKIIILDKIADPEKAPNQVRRDYVSAETVEDLFDRLEHSTVPGRVKTVAEDIAIEEAKPAAPISKKVRAAAEGATGAERFYAQFEFKHTKTGEALFGAAMLNRTSPETYKQALAIAKQHGGRYNKFVGGGALRGFLFKSAADRTAFMDEAGALDEVSAGLGETVLRDITDQRTIEVDGVRRPIRDTNGNLVAPDFMAQIKFWREFDGQTDERGRPIVAPTLRDIAERQTNTAAFKKWFGNSKVMKGGQPMVVYHGRSGEFEGDAFRNGESVEGAIWFTDETDEASWYASGGSGIYYGEGEHVMPVYLSLQNPHRIDLNGKLDYESYAVEDAIAYAKENGHDGLIITSAFNGNEETGYEGSANENQYVVFSPEQVKSAIGNAGMFDPSNPSMLRDVSDQLPPLMAGTPTDSEPKRVATLAKLKAARRALEEGRITDKDFQLRVDVIVSALEDRNASKATPKPRERGPEWIMERLMRARRTGELDEATVSFALWALNKNPAIAEDLGISLRAAGESGTAGMYNPVSRVISLFKGAANEGTAVHEILHHTERMMPADVQAKIVQAWRKAFGRAYAAADEKTRTAMDDLLTMASSSAAAKRAKQAFADGVLDYDQHYQLSNPSEYWAVNATRILSERYEAGSWVAKAKTWLGELVQKARGWLGLPSDAAVLRGLQAVLEGTGEKLSPRMLVEQAFGQGDYALRALANPPPAATWTAPDMTRLDDVIQVLQDKHIDIKRTVDTVRDVVTGLEDKWDPYLQEELFHGRAATGFKEYLNSELRPLLTDMQARGVALEEFEQFLHMRHAEEANDQIASINPNDPAMQDGGSGIDTADARNYLAGLPPAKRAAYNALAARVDAMTAQTQQMLVDYGLESQNTIDAWNATYQHYVPLMREDMDAGGGNGTGRGFSVRGPASKRRMGSKRKVVNILANLAMARERAVVRGEKNRLDLALYGLALQAPNPAFWKPVNPQKNPAALDAELQAMGLTPAHAAALVEEVRKRRVNPKTGLVERVLDLRERLGDHVVSVRVGGEDRFIFFNKDEPRARRMAETINNIGNDGVNRVLSIIGVATRWFASVNTQYNPIFGVVNLTRDLGEGAVNLSSTPIAGKQVEFVAEASRMLLAAGKHGLRLDQMTGADAALWAEFQKEGGITGHRAMFSTSDDRAKELAKELRAMTMNPAGKAGKAVLDWLSDYNEALENVTRMAAYKIAKAEGMTPQRAASLAKNLTVNFNRKGAVGAQVNSLYAFFNAATQGIARMAKTLNGPAGKKIIAGGLMIGVLQAFLLAAAGFDDQEPPEYVRAKNLVIPVGGKKYVSIPYPLGFAFLPTTGRLVTEFALGGAKKPGKYVSHLASAIMDTFNPIGAGGSVTQTLSFTVTDPIVALEMNEDWKGKKIAKEDFNSLKPTPGHTRAKDTASGVGKAVSYALNTITGGNEYTPGKWSPTPDQVDYLIGQLTGGVGREALKAQQTVSAIITGEELPAYKIPLAGRFYGDAGDKSSVSTRFYDNLKQLNEAEQELEGRRQAKDGAREYLADHPEAKMADQAQAVQREIAALRKRKSDLLEKGDKARVKETELRIRTLMERFNEKVEARTSTTP